MLHLTTTATNTPADLPAILATITALDASSARHRTIVLGDSANATTMNNIAATSMPTMAHDMIMARLGDVEV